ncbi:hypothetical protein LGH74_10385 [Hymenobacter sp. BT178]|uniref:DUF1634 domain-containing protein n=1 Tax=Hymenobacter lucidus TaxID=2880930 RepID=A0ABS8ASJ2_9BACT|nr:hypothetical protein [Hymenobacter lucidus]
MQELTIKRIERIHTALLMLLSIFSVYCFLYFFYQSEYYHGDGLGNLPAGAPSFMHTIKSNSCLAVAASVLVAAVWVPFAGLTIWYAPTIRRRLLLVGLVFLTALLYVCSFSVPGMYICW